VILTAEAQRTATGGVLPVVLGLGQRARRAASIEELTFVMVNETVAVAPYRQAVLWSAAGGVIAVSGVAVPERNAPFTIWLDRLLRPVGATLDSPTELEAIDFAGSQRDQWEEWLPACLLVIPLRAPDGNRLGLLGFARAQPWSEAETVFLGEIAETYALAWAWHGRLGAWQSLCARFAGVRYRWWLIAAAVLAVGLAPVRLSVLAPGEVVARDPAAIRAPIEGVIDKVFILPNEHVADGQLLLEFDTTTVRGKLEVAQQALTTAKAEYEQAALQAFSDLKAKAQLGVLSGHIGERKADIGYLNGLLERSRIKAPRAGVAVLDDPSEWIGRPVSIGEKVLAVADEHDTELEGWLAPGDMIELPTDSPVILFLNVDPIHPIHAKLRYVAYESMLLPDGTLAHRLRATITDTGDKPRLGLKGTIRVDSHRVPLVYWLFRRPWAVLRQTFGI
jgi:hypothetical protein